MVILGQLDVLSKPTFTQDAAAIVLYALIGTAVYFLKQFADGVRETTRALGHLKTWVALIAHHLGIEEPGHE